MTCTAVDAPGTTNDDFKITSRSPFDTKYTSDNINTCSIPITIVFLPIGILLFTFSEIHRSNLEAMFGTKNYTLSALDGLADALIERYRTEMPATL